MPAAYHNGVAIVDRTLNARKVRRGRELLEALIIAEEEGVRAVSEIRHELREKIRKRKAA